MKHDIIILRIYKQGEFYENTSHFRLALGKEAMVNQASMTGESVPVKKEKGMYVYAGTAIEEGEITLCVKKAAGSTRFERIVTMMEESEQLKSTAEGLSLIHISR